MQGKHKIRFEYTEIDVQPFSSSARKIKLFRPIIPVTIFYDQKFVHMEALIDSGADYNIFHGDVAAYLGINLALGSKKIIHGVAGKIKGYEHKIDLKVGQVKFRSNITFSNQIPDNFTCVLGGKGFFDHFQVTLDYSQRAITLIKF